MGYPWKFIKDKHAELGRHVGPVKCETFGQPLSDIFLRHQLLSQDGSRDTFGADPSIESKPRLTILSQIYFSHTVREVSNHHGAESDLLRRDASMREFGEITPASTYYTLKRSS